MVYIIGELCGQWGGSMDRAKTMIDECASAGLNAVKVQLWDTYKLPGDSRERWEYLMMSKEQFLELNEYAKARSLEFFASAFDRERFQWICNAGLKYNKIASSLLKWDYKLCEEMLEHSMMTFVSLGCWDNSLALPFDAKNIVYMHCVAKYPHSTEEALSLMPAEFDRNTVRGYSDHTVGIDMCKKSIDRGAQYLEVHVTTDKSLQSATEGAHVCSKDYKELKELVKYCD